MCQACLEALERTFDSRERVLGDIRIIAPFLYEGLVKNTVVDFKYHRIKPLARYMAVFMARRLRGASGGSLVPVPLHLARKRERGFSQTVLLAVEISRITGLPVRNCLRRTRYTAPQVELPGHEREENIRGAFALAGPKPPGPVFLVDDVATTGSTLNEAASALPGQRVMGLVFALARPGEDNPDLPLF